MAQSLGMFGQIRRAFESRVGQTHKNQKCAHSTSVKVKKISINNFSRKIFYVIHLGNDCSFSNLIINANFHVSNL